MNSASINIGEQYIVTPDAAMPDRDGYKRPMKGTVVWIHPKGRFAELEFEGVNGKFRECFLPENLTAKNLVPQKKGGKR